MNTHGDEAPAAGTSDLVVFGALRCIRVLLAVWVAWAIVGAISGLVAAFQWHRGPSYFVMSIVAWGQLLAALACFEGSRRLINAMHRQSFGRPHPRMLALWGL